MKHVVLSVFLAAAKEDKTARYFGEEFTKVLGNHDRLAVFLDLVGTYRLTGCCSCMGGAFRPVDRRCKFMGIAEFTGCPGHSAGMLHNGPHADFNEGLHLRRRAARITGHDDVRRNGIMSAIRMKFCHGHDGRFQGIGIS